MTSATKVRLLRWFSHLCIVAVLVLGGVLAALQAQQQLTDQQQLGGVSLVAVLFLLWFLIQLTLDRWLIATLGRSELANDGTFDLLYNSSPVAHLTLDEAGSIIDYNPTAVRLFNSTIDSLRGRAFVSLCPPEFDTSVIAGKIKAEITMNEVELPLATTTGDIIWVLFSVYSLRRRGERLVTLIDITELKKVDTAKSEFVALATHQLRTPITAIRFSAELLGKRLGEGLTQKNVDYVEKINRNVQRMLALINDFLNVSKLEMGTFATEATSINVSNFITETLEEFDERIAKQQLTVVRHDGSTDLTLHTDPRLLNIILSNIISNAVKYTPAAGKIDITFINTGSAVQFDIQDSGIGIPADDLPQLFKKFFRASNARVRQTEGTGLGLYVVEQAVKQLGGTIAVTSSTEAGTNFTITLPLSTPH